MSDDDGREHTAQGSGTQWTPKRWLVREFENHLRTVGPDEAQRLATTPVQQAALAQALQNLAEARTWPSSGTAR